MAADVRATGVVQIEIEDPPVRLRVTFEKSGDGDSWTVDSLREALTERGVPDTVPADALRAFLTQAARSDGAYSEVLLEGTSAQLPTPDTVHWDESVTHPPPEIEVPKRALDDAPAPHIYRDPATGESRPPGPASERVYIDPTVEHAYFVDSEAHIGKVNPRRQGHAGTDIFGRTIPAKQLADPGFYTGANIRRTAQELYSEVSGILRVGRNWADIVPFARHRWTVELSQDKATCSVEFEPGSPEDDPPSGELLRATAVELPYPEESLLPADDIDALIRRRIEQGTPGRIFLSLSRDASFDIAVSEDRMSALLNIHKGTGRGTGLNLKAIGTAIKQSGLKGLDFDRIRNDIMAFYNGPEFDLTGYVLAEGTAPTPGPDRQIEYAIRFFPDHRAEELKNRLIEVRNESTRTWTEEEEHSYLEFPPEHVQHIAPVEREQLICQIDPPTPGAAGTDVYGMQVEGTPGSVPEIRLFGGLEQKEQIIIAQRAGLLDYAEIDGRHHLRVRAHADPTITVSVAPDRRTATLSLQDGAGTGKRLTREAVDAAIAAANVVHGVLEDVVDKSIAAAQTGIAVDSVVFARATDPIDQPNAEVDFTFDTQPSRAVRIRDDGSADYKTQNRLVVVNEGQELCRIHPPVEEPVDGTDVTGNPIEARKAGAFGLELGDNVTSEETPDSKIIIRARTRGEVVYDGRSIDVRMVHLVDGDVDLSVGNLKFPGSVGVKGTVRSGFFLVSGGDVTIEGGVEAALVSSDGDLIIKQGVKGAGKAVLRSKKGIMSPFVELSTVLAVGDIVLKTAAVRCRIKCNGRITFQGDKGRVVGGSIRAREGIEAASLGSPRGVRTMISFGQDYLVADLIEKEEREIEKIKKRITQVDIEMRRGERESRTDALAALRTEKIKLLKLMEKRGLRLFTLRERFEQHFPSNVVVTGAAHAGTVFESHGRTYEITFARKAIVVKFNAHTGNIDIADLNEQGEAKHTR